MRDGTGDLFAGLAAKEEALAKHEVEKRDVLAEVRTYLARLAMTGAIVSADDARWWLEVHAPEWLFKRKDWMGALFRTGEWTPVGWITSRHKDNHARVIRTWRLKSFVKGTDNE